MSIQAEGLASAKALGPLKFEGEQEDSVAGMVDGGLEGVEVERGGEISCSNDLGFYSGSNGSFGCLEQSRVVI